MSSIRKLVALAALMVAGSAFAADARGVYLLAGAGNSKFNDSCAGTTACDTTGNASKVVAGYRLGNGIAIEGLALDLGKATASIGSATGDFKASAYGGGVAVYADIGSWLFNARLGLASVKVKASFRGSIAGGTSETTTSAYAGIGAGYRFTDTVSVELGYDSTRGKLAGESENISAFTVGLGVRF